MYGEWGVSTEWTVSAKYERVDFETSNVFDSDGWRLTGRRQLWSGQTWVSSVEFGVLEGAALGGFRGCEDSGLEVGAGAGWSDTTRLGDVYIGGMVSHRAHESGCYHDRFEGVIGYTPPEGLTWTVQLWSERGEDDRSDKIEIMMSKRFDRFEPGIGYRKEVSGEFEESALVVSIAFRP